MVTAQNKEIQSLLRDAYDPKVSSRFATSLSAHKTLAMRPFPARPVFRVVRDRLLARHEELSRRVDARQRARRLRPFRQRPAGSGGKHRQELGEVLSNPARADRSHCSRSARKQQAMHRPHVRFNGDDGTELQEDWSHAQNNALGYFVWLYTTLAEGRLPVDEIDLQTLADFVPI